MPSAAATIKKQTITKKTTVVPSVSQLFGTRGDMWSRDDRRGKLDIAVMCQPGCDTQRGYANHHSAHTPFLRVTSCQSKIVTNVTAKYSWSQAEPDESIDSSKKTGT